MNFNISVPELCLIRFCVREQTGLFTSDFVGQYTLPFTSLKRGEPQRLKVGGGGGEVGSGTKRLNYIRWHCGTIVVFPLVTADSVSIAEGWIPFHRNASVLLRDALVLSGYTHISFDARLHSAPQATAGCLWDPETDAAWIQLPSLSLFGILKYSSPYQTLSLLHTHTLCQEIEKRGWCRNSINRNI